MIKTIVPDLPFTSSFKKVIVSTMSGALIFPLGFLLGRYALQMRDVSIEQKPSYQPLLSFLSQNVLYLICGVFFLFMIRAWYIFNKIKHIKQIQYDTLSEVVIIEYRSLFSKQLKRDTIKKENLVFNFTKAKKEAEISNTLIEPFLLNNRTGFSLEKLEELQHLIIKDKKEIA